MSWGTSRNVTSDEITARPDLTSMNRIIGNAESYFMQYEIENA